MLFYLLAAIAAAIPLPLIKQYTLTKDFIWIILSIISYLILVYTYVKILENDNMSVVYPILKIVSILIVVFSGVIIFGDKLDQRSIIGILLGIIAIYMLSSKLKN